MVYIDPNHQIDRSIRQMLAPRLQSYQRICSSQAIRVS